MSGPMEDWDFCIDHNHYIPKNTDCPIHVEALKREAEKAYVQPERDPNTEYPKVGTDQQGYVYTGDLERFIAAYLTANPAFLKDLVNRTIDERIVEDQKKALRRYMDPDLQIFGD